MSEMTRHDDLRQALDDSVLTHTGRSLGDLASQRVIEDIWPLVGAREAALLLVVRAVAKSNPYGSWLPPTNAPAGVVCRWCMERAYTPAQCQHDQECAWRQARALMDRIDADNG